MHNLLGLKVKDAYRLNDENPIVVRLNDEIGKIVDSFTFHAELSGIFVVENDGRFSGVITRTDLLD